MRSRFESDSTTIIEMYLRVSNWVPTIMQSHAISDTLQHLIWRRIRYLGQWGPENHALFFFYGTPVERSLLFSNFKMKVHHFFIFLSYILFTWQYLIEHHLRYLSMERCLALQGVNSSQSRATQVSILLLFSCPFYCLCHCFLISCVYNHPKISLKFKAAPTFSLSMYNLSNLGDPLRTISPSQTPSTS